MAVTNNTVTGWVGWVYFAGILMILRGASEAFLGITALINKQYIFITNSNNQLVASVEHVQTWGWVSLVVGLIVMAAGFSLLHGGTLARILGVAFASAAFLVNMAFLGVFPAWSIIAMIVDVLIIYALVVHGREAAV
jgi:hypothetical protein